MQSNDELLDKIHIHIGACCTIWAEIESMVVEIILRLALHHNVVYAKYEARLPLLVILKTMDLRGKVEAAKALAFIVLGDGELFERISKDLNELSNDLRNKRNRLIHDQWRAAIGGGLAQTKHVAKVVNTQARTKRVILHEEIIHKDISELEGFKSSLESMFVRLYKHTEEIRLSPRRGKSQP